MAFTVTLRPNTQTTSTFGSTCLHADGIHAPTGNHLVSSLKIMETCKELASKVR